jgi:hypothetical protein
MSMPKLLAEVNHGWVDVAVVGGGPEFKLVALTSAAVAVVTFVTNVDGEDATTWGRVVVQRTWSIPLTAPATCWSEADQLQNLLHGDFRSQLLEVDSRHGPPRWRGLGYEVAAVTGRPEQEGYLKDLGAARIVAREDLAETVKRPLEAETWAGCVDAVGGAMLARVLGQVKYGGSVAAVGLAGGAGLPATVIPFLLRGVNLLGIDSVMQPYENRLRAWERVAQGRAAGQARGDDPARGAG